jgi:RNA polymerase sigma-70 factor, ECF subfamily
MALAMTPISLHPFSLSPRSDISLSPLSPLEVLLERVAGHDRDAFSALYDELAPLVFGLALRVTRSRALAEEVTQEVFVQLWAQADRFDGSRGSARSWIATIAHRRAVDTVRRTQSSSDREASLPVDVPHPDVAEAVIQLDESAQVRTALESLTALQREAIELAYFEGLTYRKVAERLDIPLGTVKTRMRDGLLRIRGKLEERE